MNQRGFVLILALVLLAVMTLIAVSSMNSANLELRASSNAKQHQIAFDAVQSLLEFALSGDAANTLDFQDTKTATQSLGMAMTGTKNLTATMTLAGCGPGVGSSLEEGKSFSYNYYQIVGSGQNKTGTATSIQAEGVRYPAAACD